MDTTYKQQQDLIDLIYLEGELLFVPEDLDVDVIDVLRKAIKSDKIKNKKKNIRGKKI